MKKVFELGERELIRRYAVPQLQRYTATDLVDDCATLPLKSRETLLVTTDSGPKLCFLNRLGIGTYEDFGHFFATISLSDIAAMGGRLLGLVAACTVESEFPAENYGKIIAGMALACEESGGFYLGGDTSEGSSLRIVTTAIGLAEPDKVLYRKPVEPGDVVCVSGPVGTTLASYISSAKNQASVVHRPRARIDFGLKLSKFGLAKACIDMSDGPLGACVELAEANDVMLILDTDALPIAESPDHCIQTEQWMEFILNVGGDFELLFTVSPNSVRKVEAIGGIPCGRVEPSQGSQGVRLSGSGAASKIQPWEHFRSTERISEMLESFV